MSKQWIKRVSEPDIKSKYYTTKAGKGLNGCIQGNASTNKVKNRQTTYSVMPNCTGYAHARSLEIMRATEPCTEIPTCNAEDWNDMSKWEHGQTPKLGAIACWRSGKNWDGSDGCGHVAIVEEVYSDGSFLISESGWSSFYFRTKRIPANKFYGSGLTFECFLYNPYANKNFEEVKADAPGSDVDYKKYLPKRGWIAKGDNIELVGRIAEFMYRMFPLYTKKAALGNIYGPNIIASISEFQRRIIGTKLPSGAVFTRADADGLIGPKTLEALVVHGFKL